MSNVDLLVINCALNALATNTIGPEWTDAIWAEAMSVTGFGNSFPKLPLGTHLYDKYDGKVNIAYQGHVSALLMHYTNRLSPDIKNEALFFIALSSVTSGNATVGPGGQFDRIESVYGSLTKTTNSAIINALNVLAPILNLRGLMTGGYKRTPEPLSDSDRALYVKALNILKVDLSNQINELRSVGAKAPKVKTPRVA